MKTRIVLIFTFFAFAISTQAQLRSGPMLGYAYFREVMIWLQTEESAEVYIKYVDIATDESYITEKVITEKSTAFTAHLLADKCKPGKKYSYEIYINDSKIDIDVPLTFKTQRVWDENGNFDDFRILTGSCAFISEKYFDRPGEPYGQHYEIFESMAKMNGDIMVWLGDNIYYREADWYSRSGMIARNNFARAIPEYKQFLATCNHYAIWDDHDYGPNDSDRGYRNKKDALDIFKMFWANPHYGNSEAEGVFFKFSYNDVDFFMLDNRYHRSPTDRMTGDKTILGEVQLKWLLEGLASSKANFKIITMGGEFLSNKQTHEYYAKYPEERQKILDHIIAEEIEGVLFLNGDLHMSDLCVWEPRNFYPILDFTVSPLTSGPYKEGCDKNEPMRIEGTCISERNYGVIDVSGERENRALRLAIYNKNGNLVWERKYTKQELSIKR
jgi:alkaline phosphatase D